MQRLSGLAHWFPRLGLASIFVYHGLYKVSNAAIASELVGVPSALILLHGLVELVGAALILWGGHGPDWATRLGAGIFAVVMVGAIGYVLPTFGWNQVVVDHALVVATGATVVGVEFHVLILCTALLFAMRGNQLNALDASVPAV